MNRTSPIPYDLSTTQAVKLLQRFDRSTRNYRPILVALLAGESSDKIIRESRYDFEFLLPAIPYIGGNKNNLTHILIDCTMYLALYRVLTRRGLPVEEIGRIVVEIEDLRVRAYPHFLIRLAGWYIHTQLGKRHLQRIMVEDSQKHHYQGGWVATFVEGDGRTFDIGIDHSQCAVCKFFEEQGAGEFTCYVCLIDYIQQRAMEAGFSRTTTLAEGGDRCDFRWQKGQETRPAWPPPWLESPAEEKKGWGRILRGNCTAGVACTND